MSNNFDQWRLAKLLAQSADKDFHELGVIFLVLFVATVAIGPKAPLHYSAFTAPAGAFLLFDVQPRKQSLPMDVQLEPNSAL